VECCGEPTLFWRSETGRIVSGNGLILHAWEDSINDAKEYYKLLDVLRAAIEPGSKSKITLSKLRQIAATLEVAEQDKE
jgi:hypothetical protein